MNAIYLSLLYLLASSFFFVSFLSLLNWLFNFLLFKLRSRFIFSSLCREDCNKKKRLPDTLKTLFYCWKAAFSLKYFEYIKYSKLWLLFVFIYYISKLMVTKVESYCYICLDFGTREECKTINLTSSWPIACKLWNKFPDFAANYVKPIERKKIFLGIEFVFTILYI